MISSLAGNRETRKNWEYKYGISGVPKFWAGELEKGATTYRKHWKRTGTGDCMPDAFGIGGGGGIQEVGQAYALRGYVAVAGRSMKEEWKDWSPCCVEKKA